MSDTGMKPKGAAANSPSPAMPPRTPRLALVGAAVALGALWRLALIPVYWGWEESDYGDLAMIRGVLDARFLHYDMNHLPGYYALGAAALAVVGDTVLASLLVSLAGGLIALGAAVGLADRVLGRRAALATAALLIVQPEFALYSASAMREPVYGALLMGVLAGLFSERLALASLAAGGAFLMRMDAAAVLAPVLVLHALGQAPRPRRLVEALAPLALVMLGWSAYCWWDHGTPLFWQDAVAVNVATGGGAAPEDRLVWWRGGLGVVAAMGGWLLPWRIGWGVWLGLALAWRLTPWARHGPRRTWALLAGSATGVWLGMGLTAQHGWNHNLYWKWLCGLVPVIVPLGVAGLEAGLARLKGRAAPRLLSAMLVALVIQGLSASLWETARQVHRSAVLYKPQVLLARWIEQNVPEQDNLILDNIPSCWINRNPMSRRMITWMDVPTPDGDEAAFAAWLLRERVRYALFFQEDWTEAPRRAPFLAAGRTWSAGGVTLHAVAREDDYGWIFYTVTPDGQRPPPAPDPAALGAEP